MAYFQNNFQDQSWVMEQVLGYKWLSEYLNKRFEDGVKTSFKTNVCKQRLFI
jgi:hypothetical protein